MSIIVMFPDLRGETVLERKFPNQIRQVSPDAVLAPILNGYPFEQLCWIANKISDTHCRPIIAASAKGLLQTLTAGYQEMSKIYANATIVRLDTAEHPIQWINFLAQRAAEINGLAIGDLTLSTKTSVVGSSDELSHLNIFPALFGQFTNGQLPLSGAHGFQAFAPGVINRIINKTLDIVEEAKRELGGEMEWGFDGAMALSAYKLSVPIALEKIPAIKMRNRGRQKIAQQFEQALRLCRASTRI